jgi:GNAT superfamily N-acetyltransferase
MADPTADDAAPELVLEVRSYSDPDITRMVEEVQAEYVVLYGGPDAAAVDPDEFSAPNGLILVGTVDGEPVAMGGWRRAGGADAEIKRMYVAARARRRGLARRVLAEVEQTALAAGVERLVLNTGLAQPEAIALYRQQGYRDIEPFGHYSGSPDAVFLGKRLSGE